VQLQRNFSQKDYLKNYLHPKIIFSTTCQTTCWLRHYDSCLFGGRVWHAWFYQTGQHKAAFTQIFCKIQTGIEQGSTYHQCVVCTNYFGECANRLTKKHVTPCKVFFLISLSRYIFSLFYTPFPLTTKNFTLSSPRNCLGCTLPSKPPLTCRGRLALLLHRFPTQTTRLHPSK